MGDKTIERIAEELGVNFHDLFPLIAARDKKYYKAGQKKVVEWVDENIWFVAKTEPQSMWQDFKKERGL